MINGGFGIQVVVLIRMKKETERRKKKEERIESVGLVLVQSLIRRLNAAFINNSQQLL